MSGAYGDADEMTRITFRAPESLVEDLEATIEAGEQYGNRSDCLRGLIREYINGDDEDASARIRTGAYLPDEQAERELYQACLDYSTAKFIVVENRHFAKIAEETKISENRLDIHLTELEKAGYVRRLGVPPNVQDPPSRWRVKPPAADPEQWTHRRPTGEEARERAEQRLDALLAPVESEGSGEAARRGLDRMQAAADGGEDGGEE